jgi:hypothetical protein
VFSESCPLPTGALLDAKDPDTARVEGLSGDPATRWRHQEEKRDTHTRGRPETTGRMLSVAAAGRNTRVSRLPGPLVLPVEGSVSEAA